MTIKRKFTPEVLLSAPRRSAALPSADGKLALYTQSTYSFDTHSRTNEICVLDLTQGTSITLSKEPKASEPRWLGSGYEVVWLKQCENGSTSFVVSDATVPGKFYVAGTVSGPVSSLKLYVVEPGVVGIAVAGQADPEGCLHNPKNVPKSHTTARIYDSLFARHWDRWEIPGLRNSIFTAVLQRSQPAVTSRSGRYTLQGFKNALQGSDLESPIPTFGGADHFDISAAGLAFVAKDPELDPATHTKCNCYFILDSDLKQLAPTKPHKISRSWINGAASSPVWSPGGFPLAFLQMPTDQYESDRNLILVYDTDGVEAPRVLSDHAIEGASWPSVSPISLKWSNDGKMLLFEAEDTGRGCLFALNLYKEPTTPRKLTSHGYILDHAPLSTESNLLLVSRNTLVDNSQYTLVDPDAQPSSEPRLVSSLSRNGSMFGLSPDQVHELWWKGANDHPVHAWMVRPSSFRAGSDQKYPLAYLIHGGPQGAWNDQWSTRWNPAVFAEQGYVVICPNPTGSTGYGQDFTDAIRRQWGGRPFEDLVKGFEYIESSLSFVDTSRAVALGASYGGYMMNWIQGHPFGTKFKALVCHDGVFSMTGQLASDEQYFPIHDMGGTIWEQPECYQKWDPARPDLLRDGWKTPMLVIHNELDYRLTVAEGLAAFNVLQMKGVESRFLSFPDENHWVLKPENSLVWHLVVLNWINKFVGLPKVVDRQGRDGSGFCVEKRVLPIRGHGASRLSQ